MTSIILPWPPKECSPNFKRSHHWTAYHKQVASYRSTAWALALEAKIGAPSIYPVSMAVAFFPPDKRARDEDGMIGSIKSGLDGLADAMRVDDKHFRPAYSFHDPIKPGKVVITIP